MTDHCVAQVMNSRSDCSACWFDVRASQHIRQNETDSAYGVAAVALGTPEQRAIRIRRRAGSLAQLEIALERGHDAGRQRQATILEELRLSNVDGLLAEIDIAEPQTCDLASRSPAQ